MLQRFVSEASVGVQHYPERRDSAAKNEDTESEISSDESYVSDEDEDVHDLLKKITFIALDDRLFQLDYVPTKEVLTTDLSKYGPIKTK